MPAASAMSATLAPWKPRRAKTSVAAGRVRSRGAARRRGGGGCVVGASHRLRVPRLRCSFGRAFGNQGADGGLVVAELGEELPRVLSVSRRWTAYRWWSGAHREGKAELRRGPADAGFDAQTSMLHLLVGEHLVECQHRL